MTVTVSAVLFLVLAITFTVVLI
uniref:Uncharacterized protein n=1 Tax=Rhizophora mucronata TaxID=61149 RepID=A0A2P2PUE3_RHIMU